MKKSSLMAALVLVGSASALAADYSLPFFFTASEESMKQCAVLNVNQDKETDWSGETHGEWFYYESSSIQAFKYTYMSQYDADDWLILPAVNFGDCKKVKVSFQIQTGGYPEGLEVKLGHSATIAGMTQSVMILANFMQNNSFAEKTVEITVPDDGNTEWHLGFHANSAKDQGWIYIKDIKIENAEAGEDVIIPAAPVVKSSSITDLDYSAVVTMPSADSKGNALTESMDLQVLVDGVLKDTRSACAAGSDVDIALTLAAGTHTISYQAVLGGHAGAAATDAVEAKEHVIVPAAPVIKSHELKYLDFSAVVTMPTVDTDSKEITGTMTLRTLIDGTVVKTNYYLSAGEDVNVSQTLSSGNHTIGFVATLGNEQSAVTSVKVEAKEQVYPLPFNFVPSADNKSQCVILDANGDASTYGDNGQWTVKEDAFVYTYDSRNNADDWVFLPMVDLGNVRKVKVSVDVKTGGYDEGFELKLGSARTVKAMTTSVMKQEGYQNKDNYATLTATVELPADAPSVQCLGIHAISKENQYVLYVTDICIEDAKEIIPAAPVIKESAVDALTYTATVTMPSADTEGNSIEIPMTLEILLDGEVAESKTDCAPGSDVEISLPLEAGAHTIAYKALLDKAYSEVASENVNAASVTTGSLPYSLTASQEAFDQCTVIDLSGSDFDTGSSTFQGAWSFAMGRGFKYTYNQTRPADDWLMLPAINFGESTKVKISVDVMTDYDTESFEICLGRENTVGAMTIPVLERNSFVSNNKWTTLTAEVSVPTQAARAVENNFVLGIHATSPKNHYLMYFDNIHIESTGTTAVTDIEADSTDAEPEYYNLQGIRVHNPESGIYIVRQGNKVSKIKL